MYYMVTALQENNSRSITIPELNTTQLEENIVAVITQDTVIDGNLKK